LTKAWPAQRGSVPGAQLEALNLAVEVLARQRGATLEVSSLNGVPRLEGTTPVWQDVVDLGHGLSDAWYRISAHDREVVVDVTTASGPDTPSSPARPVGPSFPELPDRTDVLVVGGGISGIIVALKLAVMGNHVTVIEAGTSLGSRTTAWNNGMVHSGFDPKPGTLKALHNVQGNVLWDRLADDLQVPLRRAGSVVVSLDEAADQRVEEYLVRAKANGVPRCEILTGDEIRAIEPRLAPGVRRALTTPTTGFVEPVDVCRAAARLLRAAGGQVVLGTSVTGVAVENGRVVGVTTTAGEIACSVLINAAGVHADTLAEQAGARSFSLHPRRGTLVIVEDDHRNPYQFCVGPVPSPYTKGGGVTLRPSGTLSLGPSAVEQQSRDHVAPTAEEVSGILEQSFRIYPDLDAGAVVSVGAQVRASSYGEDFVIGPAPGLIGFYNVAAMQSPGVASIPSVANQVASDLLDLGLITTRTQQFQDLWRKS
jgi:glycerol-3-phosphate dehydrogenase